MAVSSMVAVCLLVFVLVLGIVYFIIGCIYFTGDRRPVCDPKSGWHVYRLRIWHIRCQRCGKQYEDGDYIWQDPEKRLVCHVSCESPGSQPTEAMLDAPFDAVRGPLPVVRAGGSQQTE